jgi:hypothetical protein
MHNENNHSKQKDCKKCNNSPNIHIEGNSVQKYWNYHPLSSSGFIYENVDWNMYVIKANVRLPDF